MTYWWWSGVSIHLGWVTVGGKERETVVLSLYTYTHYIATARDFKFRPAKLVQVGHTCIRFICT